MRERWTLMIVAAAILCGGCAELTHGGSTGQLRAALENWTTAIEANDADGVLALFADDFEPPGGQTWEDFETSLRDRFLLGYFQDAETRLQAARFREENGVAEVGPVIVRAAEETRALHLTLERTGPRRSWRITGMRPGL